MASKGKEAEAEIEEEEEEEEEDDDDDEEAGETWVKIEISFCKERSRSFICWKWTSKRSGSRMCWSR